MQNEKLMFEEECYAIRGAVYEVYRELGNGFREEVYQQCLEREFAMRGIPFEAKRELTRLGLLVNFGSYPKATVERWAN